MAGPLPDALLTGINDAVFAGRKIDVIKLYREETGPASRRPRTSWKPLKSGSGRKSRGDSPRLQEGDVASPHSRYSPPPTWVGGSSRDTPPLFSPARGAVCSSLNRRHPRGERCPGWIFAWRRGPRSSRWR